MTNPTRFTRILSTTLALIAAIAAVVVAQCSTNGTAGWSCYKIAKDNTDSRFAGFSSSCGNLDCSRYSGNYNCPNGSGLVNTFTQQQTQFSFPYCYSDGTTSGGCSNQYVACASRKIFSDYCGTACGTAYWYVCEAEPDGTGGYYGTPCPIPAPIQPGS